MSTATDVVPIRIRPLLDVENMRPEQPGPLTTTLHLLRDLGDGRSPEAPLPLSALPDLTAWAGRIAVALFESVTGARSATQVMRWVSPEVYEAVVRRSGRAARRGHASRRPVRCRRVIVSTVCAPEGRPTALLFGDAVAETTVILQDHHRVRAMALRFEGVDGRWIVTACEMG